MPKSHEIKIVEKTEIKINGRKSRIEYSEHELEEITLREISDLFGPDYEEELLSVRKSILENPKLFSLATKAIGLESGQIYARLNNTFIRLCINLREVDIKKLISDFNQKFKGIKPPIETIGILNSIKYIRKRVRERKKELTEVRYLILSNDYLDVYWEIDLIEVFFSGENRNLVINNLYLVQVKSSKKTEEEINKTIRNHREFVERRMMKKSDYEDYITKGEGKIEFNKFNEGLSLLDKVEELYLLEEIDPETVLRLLGFDNESLKISKLVKAHLFLKNFDSIVSAIKSLLENKKIEEETYQNVINKLNSVKDELIGYIPIFVPINKIYSIFTEGQEVIKEVDITPKESRGILIK